MKFISTLFTLIFICCIKSQAQPAAVKQAAKSVFKLTTYKADGTALAESNGIFVSEDGVAISTLKPFLGAARATVTDVKGKQYDVVRILGANEVYDMVKFKVDAEKRIPLVLAGVSAKAGDAAWLIPYEKSNVAQTSATVNKVEIFMDKYSYYIFNVRANDALTACPFVNEKGEVIGLMKPATTSDVTHAVDARFAFSLATTGLSLNDPALRQIDIPAALPQDKDQAQLALLMAEQDADSIKLRATIDDFIALFPRLVDGYSALARVQVKNNDIEEAAKTMETAIKQVDNKGEAHAAYGQIIYNTLIYKGGNQYDKWTLERAADETNEAYAINPQPAYRHQQALITYAKGDYEQAYTEFIKLLDTPIRNPELFYEASQCKVMMKAPQTEIIALLDSAINNTDTLRMNTAAPYFYARAEAYNAADSFRQAVFDYTRYEILSGQRQNASFYLKRGQTEVKARLYQQALADMAMAIALEPKEPTYYAEMASLQLKVNLVDDAIQTADRCVKLAPDYSDGYLILGLAMVNKGDIQGGLSNLEKAKQLGNAQAQPLIDKYAKK